MADPERESLPELSFSQSDSGPTSWLPWAVAGIAVALAVGLLLLFGGRKNAAVVATGPGLAPPDPYAANLVISNLKMSVASNFAGSKVTYVDGEIVNHGSLTVTAVTVQVAFRNDVKEIAQKETLPLPMIRTREPYVDTQPVGAEPLKPDGKGEFRLVFDSVPADWNQQYPEVRVVLVSTAESRK